MGYCRLEPSAIFCLGESATQNGSPSGLSNVTTATAGGGIFRRNERYTDFGGFVQDDIKPDRAANDQCGLALRDLWRPGRKPTADWPTSMPRSPQRAFFRHQARSADLPCRRILLERCRWVWGGHRFPGLYKTPLGDVSPRFGFVWQVTNRPSLVVRGGVGFYYDEHSGNLAEQTLTQPPFASLQILSGSQGAPATCRIHLFLTYFPIPAIPSSCRAHQRQLRSLRARIRTCLTAGQRSTT